MFKRVFLGALFSLATLESSSAAPMRLPSDMQIEGLSWEVPVRSALPYRRATPHEAATSKASVMVVLKGLFQKEDWTLLFQNLHVQVQPDGAFEVAVPLARKSFAVDLVAVGPLGEVATERVNFITPDFDTIIADKLLPVNQAISPFAVSVSAGATLLNYSQTRIQDVSLVALTPKLSTTYRLSHLWDIGANGFMSAMTVSTNRPEVSVGFLGANARIGYRVPFIRDPWSFKVLVGAYYSTMLVSGSAFGYNNLFGPQVFPAVQRKVGNFSFSAYAKVSPISDGLALLDISNRELALGASAARILNGGRSYGLSVDFAQLSFATTTRLITSQSTTLGAFFQF